MVYYIVLCVMNTLAAWGFALLFIRRKRAEIWFDACLCAAVHGLLVFALYHVKYENYLFVIEVLWFLIMTLVVQLQRRDGYGNALIAFGLAQSIYAVFHFIGVNGQKIWKQWNFLCYLLFFLLFLVITCLIRNRFPSENWREYYVSGNPVAGRLHIKVWHIYFTVVSGCGLATAFMWWVDVQSRMGFVAAGISIFVLFWGEIALLVLMQAYKKERIEFLLNQQYRSEMQSFMNVIRSQRHDYNFHVQTIGGLLREGNLEECLKYTDALEKDSAIMNSVLPIKDPAISAMIHNFHFLAVREGISLQVDIQNDLTQIATNVYETNKIISNLLQNAIDEVKTHTDKTYGIHLTISKRGEYIVIRVSNEVDSLRMDPAELQNIYRHGYSTKKGHDGVGLSSIKQLAGRYHGVLYTRLEGNVIHFVAKIPINFAKQQEA